jgi:hypothetical protein
MGAEGDAEDVVGVARERLGEAGSSADGEIPDADGAVIRCGGKPARRQSSGGKERSKTLSPWPLSSATGVRSEEDHTRRSLSAEASVAATARTTRQGRERRFHFQLWDERGKGVWAPRIGKWHWLSGDLETTKCAMADILRGGGSSLTGGSMRHGRRLSILPRS